MTELGFGDCQLQDGLTEDMQSNSIHRLGWLLGYCSKNNSQERGGQQRTGMGGSAAVCFPAVARQSERYDKNESFPVDQNKTTTLNPAAELAPDCDTPASLLSGSVSQRILVAHSGGTSHAGCLITCERLDNGTLS